MSNSKINTATADSKYTEQWAKESHFLCVLTGKKFYNLSALYDAKLDMETGIAISIVDADYKSSTLPTVNSLLAQGLLLDCNYDMEAAWEPFTHETAKKMVGQVIKWSSPAYKHNLGYFGYGQYGGVERIISVSENAIQTERVDPKSDNLSFAKLDFLNSGQYHYSDSDRLVTYLTSRRK